MNAESGKEKKRTVKKKAAKKKTAAKAASKKKSVKKKVARKSASRTVAKPMADSVISNRDRYEMIAKMAYFMAEKRGFQPGSELNDWLECERIVDGMLKKAGS